MEVGSEQPEDGAGESRAAPSELLAALDLAPLLTRDVDGRIRFWSRGCEAVYGWTAAEALGCSVHELLGTSLPGPRQQIEASLLMHGEWQGELRQRRRDGAPLLISARAMLRHHLGVPVVLECLNDVTALREAEAELSTVKEKLASSMRAEAAARARAARAERMQALGELASGIAHDINNLLQAIQTSAMLIESRAPDLPRAQGLARAILRAVERGATVTRRLLTFARGEGLRKEVLDAAVLLGEARDLVTPVLHQGIAVTVAVDPGVPPVLADRGQLETTLMNLVTNARDAMPNGGVVTLRASAESVEGTGHRAGLGAGRYVALTVADTGTGMSAETLARATEAFFTTKRPGRGTGLGLAIARSFAAQSGGGIDIASSPGRGTVVTLWLPTAEDTQDGAAASLPGAVHAPRERPGS